MSKRFVIGIDAGSSSIKIGIFDRYGRAGALERIPIQRLRGKDTSLDYFEYDPEDWWQATKIGIRKLLDHTKIGVDCIDAIGLTGQIGTHVFLNRQLIPLIPAIGWQDNRAKQEAEWLNDFFPESALDELIGMHLPSGNAWPIPRLLWLRNKHPEFMNQGFYILQPKDYIGFKLTNEICTDTMSLRGLVNPWDMQINPKISNELLQLPGIKESVPKCTRPTETTGTITRDVANVTGLREGTPVITGCGDFHASLIGSGIIDTSCAFNITGTSEHVGLLCKDGNHEAYDVRLGKYPHVFGNLDILYGATSAGGGSIQWFCNTMLPGLDPNTFDIEIEKRLQNVDGYGGLIFLPYLCGERAPIWNPNARGVFFGLQDTHNINQLLHAVFLGVSYSLYDCLSVIEEHVPHPAIVRVAGAASKNGQWNQMKADVFGLPVATMECKESTCLGAAITAGVGIGWYSDIQEAIPQMTHIDTLYIPDAHKSDIYRKGFLLFRKLYQSLKPMFDDLTILRSRV